MIRQRAIHPVFKNFAYDIGTNVSNCLIAGCRFPRTTGNRSSNLVNHIKRRHVEKIEQLKKEINEHMNLCHSQKRKKEEDECMVIAKISRKDFLSGCLESVVINGRPYSIFEDSGFKKIVRPITKAFLISGRPVSFDRCILQNYAINVHDLVKSHIKSEIDGKMISLKLDLTTHMHRCIFGVNVQFYVQDTLVVRTLAMKRFLEDTKAANLAIELKNIMEDYGVDAKRIYTITTDNGPNVVKCVRIMRMFQGNQLEDYLDHDNEKIDENVLSSLVDMELESTEHGVDLQFLFHVHCSVHTMQLCLHDVFTKKGGEWTKFLSCCRDLVVELRTTKIQNIIKKRNLPIPLINIDVRWSSSHAMVSSTEKIMTIIDSFLTHGNYSICSSNVFLN